MCDEADAVEGLARRHERVLGSRWAQQGRADDVRDLADAVAALADQLDNRGQGVLASGPAPWCWRDMDAEAAQAFWNELIEWTAWLRSRYPIAERLPECWAEHPELVEELTALHAVWNAAYRDSDAHPTAPADFHDRWLPGVLARVKSWGVYCGADHRERPRGVYTVIPET